MIQLNLLPVVKQEYIRAQGTKRTVLVASFLVSAVALAVLVISLSTVYIVQKAIIAGLNSNIQSSSAALRNTPNIGDILTVQSQLNSLSALNAQKPVASRIFGYLSELTPTQATIADLRIDFGLHTMTISGNAPSLDAVNTFVDGLKFTNYSIGSSKTTRPAFSAVVLSSFSRNNQAATYSITFGFDQAIFNSADSVTLSVGNSAQPAQQPSIIFKKGS